MCWDLFAATQLQLDEGTKQEFLFHICSSAPLNVVTRTFGHSVSVSTEMEVKI